MFGKAWWTWGQVLGPVYLAISSIWPLAKNVYIFFYIFKWLQNSKEEEYFVTRENYMRFKCQRA